MLAEIRRMRAFLRAAGEPDTFGFALRPLENGLSWRRRGDCTFRDGKMIDVRQYDVITVNKK